MAGSWRDGGKNTPYDGRRKTKLIPYKKEAKNYEDDYEIDTVNDDVEDYKYNRTYSEVHKCLK